MFGPLAFSAPWLLFALATLPIIWLLLRAIPPAPVRRRFPAVTLLLGLRDDDSVSDHTPWWLLLLRMLAVAALIVGLAGPILNPTQEHDRSTDPLLVVMDASWASARDWQERIVMTDQLLADAGRAGRTAAIVLLSDPEKPVFQSVKAWRGRLAGLAPHAWTPTLGMMQTLASALGDEAFETWWLSDGLARAGRDTLLAALQAHGPVSVFEDPRPVLALQQAEFVDGAVKLTAQRSRATDARDVIVLAHGPDPAGNERILAELPLSFQAGGGTAQGTLTLPAEIRGRVTRFDLQGTAGAGAVALTDDSLRRREIALISGRENREGLELLSPFHYLRQALLPTADLVEGALGDALPANPDVVILADIATLSADENDALTSWVNAGGLLVRFAGPRLAASELNRGDEDPLMPVRLRAGGRTVGGAMSWGAPKSLAPFDKTSPFFGLSVPEDVQVTAQVLAQPDPTLADRVIAQLSDGTPLVTRKQAGKGQVVLFHVTANAEWSTLPLSGLFVDMLERLSISTSTPDIEAGDLTATTWRPLRVLDGFGGLIDGKDLPGVAGEVLVGREFGPQFSPGLYSDGTRQIARNLLQKGDEITATEWPRDVPVRGLERSAQTPLGGWLVAFALMLLAGDILATLALSGRLKGAVAILAAVLVAPHTGRADDIRAINATAEVVLAHVLTGDKAVDDVAHAGLLGLSETLFFRTSVEPADPMGVDLEVDELEFFPLLYWPITPNQPRPSAAAYYRLNQYLRSGGMILFDTRDGDIAGFGASSPNGRKLQQLAPALDIPALEPVPSDHVLTRTFYLLQEFPGRFASREIWVEAAPPDADKIEGMPFRNLNDGVTPVVVGGNDWAAAWAMDARGNSLFPVGRGLAGERQRELAYRFGVNLVMHVLTGNYKSDQVHVPALLERLGQ